jgi:uncharacterized protein with GYD domain
MSSDWPGGILAESYVSEQGNRSGGRMALVSGAVAVWLIYDMATTTEAPRQAVVVLQYFLLACALSGLVASLVKFMSAK